MRLIRSTLSLAGLLAFALGACGGNQASSPPSAEPGASAAPTTGTRSEPEPGVSDTFHDCDGCPEMVMIPAGRFLMGSPAGEKDRDDNEGPQHQVTVPDFALGKYEVTMADYRRFVDETGHEGKRCFIWAGRAGGWIRTKGTHEAEFKIDKQADWRLPGFDPTEDEAVTCVSWKDAQAYVSWLSKLTGQSYRLPSEAEWEYAARAGPTTAYGGQITEKQANFDGNVGKMTEVGSYPANAWGLHDMHGNALEWVEDCWNGNYDGAPTDGSAWLQGDCSQRVLRGGSWFSGPRTVRSAFRYGDPVFRSDNFGFRVARTL